MNSILLFSYFIEIKTQTLMEKGKGDINGCAIQMTITKDR